MAKPGFDTVANGPAAPGEADAGTGSAPATTPAPSTGASAGAAAPDAAAAGVGVQIGAYSSRKQAEEGWSSAAQNYSALSGVRHRIVEGKADIGTVYRLQAIAADRAGADALCRKLKASGLNCYVKP